MSLSLGNPCGRCPYSALQVCPALSQALSRHRKSGAAGSGREVGGWGGGGPARMGGWSQREGRSQSCSSAPAAARNRRWDPAERSLALTAAGGTHSPRYRLHGARDRHAAVLTAIVQHARDVEQHPAHARQPLAPRGHRALPGTSVSARPSLWRGTAAGLAAQGRLGNVVLGCAARRGGASGAGRVQTRLLGAQTGIPGCRLTVPGSHAPEMGAIFPGELSGQEAGKTKH